MGNEVSSSEVEDEQDGPIPGKDPEFAADVKNGPVTLQSSPGLNSVPETNHVGSKQSVQQENMIAASQKTIVFSPISNGAVTNLQTNPPPPPAKSKFRMTILRPSPGQTTFQPNGQDVGPVKPEVTLAQSQTPAPIILETTAIKQNVGGVENSAPPSALMTEVEAPKPKEISIFDRLFRPEKKVQSEAPLELEVPENQAVTITLDQNTGLQSIPHSNNPQAQNIDDYKQAAAQEPSSETASVPASRETISEAAQTTPPAEVHPVMSFFKTLVTPNKSVPKSEEEVKSEADDKKKENGGLRKSSSKKEKAKSTVPQTVETEEKGLKKSDSPKSRTLSRLFRQKTKKEEQQTPGSNVVVEQPVLSVSVNSARSAPEQVLTQDPKSSDVPPQITASEDERKVAPVPRPKPFWRKSFKADPQPSKIQENGVEEQAGISVSVNTTPEQVLALDTKPSDSIVQPQDEEKPEKESAPRPLPFWRKSFKGDPQPRKNQDNVVVEQPVVSVSVNSARSAPEQVVPQDPKPSDSDIPSTQDNEKPIQEASPWPVPFWKKSFKGEPQPQKPQENVVVEQPVVSVSVNSARSAPEQVVPQDPKPTDSDIPSTQDNEKPIQEASPWPVPFWKKSFKGEPPAHKIPENSLPEEPQPVQLTLTASAEPDPQSSKAGEKTAAAGSKSQESLGKKSEDGKNAKPKLMMFFKQLSVMGDGSNPSSEEVNEKSTKSPTLDLTDGEVSKSEKTVVTAVVEPPPQKGKENPKEKKASAEKLTKQESRESSEAAGSAQLQASDPVLAQNGGESSKDSQMKKTEKRQSLGNFFKAIGPKRMCDAEVQTDPVSIFPAEKAK